MLRSTIKNQVGFVRANDTSSFVPERQNLNIVAANAIDQLNSYVAVEAEHLGLIGILLTGSFARKEGTLICERNGSTRWLSDIEYLAIVPGRGPRDKEAVGQSLVKATASLTKQIGVKVDFGVIGADRLPKLRDSIFARELTANAKLIWGDSRQIMLPAKTCAEDLRRDGLRLLQNRIVEQLETRVRHEQRRSLGIETFVAIQKLWQDIGTSLAIFLGCYQPSYMRRLEALERNRCAMRNEFGRYSDGLLSNVRTATLARFGTFPPYFDLENQLRESWQAAAGVWKWGNERLTRRKVSLEDWKAIAKCIRRATLVTFWARDYYRALRNVRDASRLTRISIRPALASGCPGNAIYAAGCLLFVFWDSIRSGTDDGLSAIEFAGRVLHRRFAASELHSAALSIYDAWKP
jgi:hypothetical protein